MSAPRCQCWMNNGLRCQWSAKWSVLTTGAELEVCGIHVRRLHDHPHTLAVEPLDKPKAAA